MARITPILPITAGSTLFQPVYVDDIAAAAEKAVIDGVEPGVYELGGPDVESFRALIDRMLKIVRRRRLVLDLPTWIARIKAFFFELGDKLTGGLIPAMLTRDQIKSLQTDNVVAEGAQGFEHLGIVPTAMDDVLEEYLYSYRPYGQYSEITASAKDLQT